MNKTASIDQGRCDSLVNPVRFDQSYIFHSQRANSLMQSNQGEMSIDQAIIATSKEVNEGYIMIVNQGNASNQRRKLRGK